MAMTMMIASRPTRSRTPTPAWGAAGGPHAPPADRAATAARFVAAAHAAGRRASFFAVDDVERWPGFARTTPSATLHVLDALVAFANGSLIGFGVRTIVGHPGALAWTLGVPLVPWSAALATLAATGHAALLGFSAAALAAWSVFAAILAAGLLHASRRPEPRLLGALATAATADAALSMIPRRRRPRLRRRHAPPRPRRRGPARRRHRPVVGPPPRRRHCPPGLTVTAHGGACQSNSACQRTRPSSWSRKSPPWSRTMSPTTSFAFASPVGWTSKALPTSRLLARPRRAGLAQPRLERGGADAGGVELGEERRHGAVERIER